MRRPLVVVEHTVRRHEHEQRLSCTGQRQVQHFLGTVHVGRFQRLVRQDPVDVRTIVENDVDGRREFVKLSLRQAKPWRCQVTHVDRQSIFHVVRPHTVSLERPNEAKCARFHIVGS
jgi:hypothetical protein